MTDATFLKEFEACNILPADFNHKAHLRLCWYCLQSFGSDEAKIKVPHLIQQYVAFVGAKDKYNHTLTMVAISLVESRMQDKTQESFNNFLACNQDLLLNFKSLLEVHYSSTLLNSSEASSTFIEPDKVPFCSYRHMANLYPHLHSVCKQLSSQFDLISDERTKLLLELSAFISNEYNSDRTPNIIVICTHNSRRSHMGQLWLTAAAEFYNLPRLKTFSGGTEATAFFPSAVRAMREVGFRIKAGNEKNNPHYYIKWCDDMTHYEAYSTRFDEAPNPSKDFGAVMVCNSADEACPIVPGAKFRIALPFDDPKEFDNTPIEAEKYLERCQDIGREMLWVMSKVIIPATHQATE